MLTRLLPPLAILLLLAASQPAGAAVPTHADRVEQAVAAFEELVARDPGLLLDRAAATGAADLLVAQSFGAEANCLDFCGAELSRCLDFWGPGPGHMPQILACYLDYVVCLVLCLVSPEAPVSNAGALVA